MSKSENLAKQILAADDLPLVQCEIPEWGGGFYLRPLTANQRTSFVAKVAKATSISNKGQAQEALLKAAVELITFALSDKDGNLIFPDQEEGFTILSKKNGTVVDRIAAESLALNKLMPNDIEDEAKN